MQQDTLALFIVVAREDRECSAGGGIGAVVACGKGAYGGRLFAFVLVEIMFNCFHCSNVLHNLRILLCRYAALIMFNTYSS